MCSAGGALPSSTVWNANTLSQAGYLSLSASVVTPDRLAVTGGVSCSTLKSFVQSNVCQSLAATCDAASPSSDAGTTHSGRTNQSIAMSAFGVPSVHYQQGMLVSRSQPASLPLTKPTSRPPTQLLPQKSTLFRPLVAKHKTSKSVVKKRHLPGQVDRVGSYKKVKLHPMAPPVLQSKQHNVAARSQ